jgi:hypothetical protein
MAVLKEGAARDTACARDDAKSIALDSMVAAAATQKTVTDCCIVFPSDRNGHQAPT